MILENILITTCIRPCKWPMLVQGWLKVISYITPLTWRMEHCGLIMEHVKMLTGPKMRGWDIWFSDLDSKYYFVSKTNLKASINIAAQGNSDLRWALNKYRISVLSSLADFITRRGVYFPAVWVSHSRCFHVYIMMVDSTYLWVICPYPQQNYIPSFKKPCGLLVSTDLCYGKNLKVTNCEYQ